MNIDSTVSYFYVNWDTSNVEAGKLEYPHVTDNACDGGTVVDDYCSCITMLEETAVFSDLPTREQVLSDLNVGAFDPVMFDNGDYKTVVETGDPNGVSVYADSSMPDYSTETIFRIKDEHSDYIFLKNVQSTVKVCNGAFSFRNSPTFFDIVNPELISAYQETDAYMSHVSYHDSGPPFVCKSLFKHFGHSNPSPAQVLECSNAYKTGVYTWLNPENSSEFLSIGNGKRGSLGAIAASIALSRDSISPTLDGDFSSGGLKEPLLKLMQVMRGFEFQRALHHRRTDGLLNGGFMKKYLG